MLGITQDRTVRGWGCRVTKKMSRSSFGTYFLRNMTTMMMTMIMQTMTATAEPAMTPMELSDLFTW